MKFPSLAEIISEFNGINHTPDFKAVRSMKNCRCDDECRGCSRVASRAPSRCPSGASTPVRKHSVESQKRLSTTMITVGADEVPIVSVTPPSQSGATTPNQYRYTKYVRNSYPCISTAASSTSLKDRLNKLKASTESRDGMKHHNEKDEDGEDDQEEIYNESSDFPCTSTSYRII